MVLEAADSGQTEVAHENEITEATRSVFSWRSLVAISSDLTLHLDWDPSIALLQMMIAPHQNHMVVGQVVTRMWLLCARVPEINLKSFASSAQIQTFLQAKFKVRFDGRMEHAIICGARLFPGQLHLVEGS